MLTEDQIAYWLNRPSDAIDEIDRIDCEESLLGFTRRIWPVLEPGRKFVEGWPLEAICEHLEAITYGDLQKVLINVPPGFMKLCADSTPILTPDGYRAHGDLRVGDRVFAPDGTATTVLRVSDKAPADYEVTFSTHETIKCNGDHLWTVFDRFAKKWKTVDTRYLAAAETEPNRSRFFIPDTAPLQFPARDLPLHPYFLGCWLGDGTSSKPAITHDKDDRQHLDRLDALGYIVTKEYHQGRTVRSEFTGQGIIQTIRAAGLFKNKHIPLAYLTASVEQRCELLAGLIDTDGHVDQKRGRALITTTEPKFAEEIQRLILSLGMRPYTTVFNAPGYGEYRSVKKTHIIGFQPTMPLPTTIPRKAVDGRNFERRRRAITSVKVSNRPEVGHCITVDRPDGLYVVGRTNVVTHNSLLVDVIWPAWEWGPRRLPSLRYVAFSYSADLTHRDNRRFRDVMLSHDYGRLFGDRFALMKTGETLVSNDKTGWKLATSVGGVGTGERGDRVICFPADTLVLTERGPLRIGEIVRRRLQLRAWSLGAAGAMELQPISGWHKNPGDRLVRLVLADGSKLVCTAGHRILTSGGYVEARNLSPGDWLYAASSRMHVPAAPVTGSQGQVKVPPSSTIADTGNRLTRHAKLIGEHAGGVVVTIRDLAHQFLREMRSAILERAVSLGVSDVLRSRAVFDIAQSGVGAVPVTVPNLLASGAWADKRLRHHLMREAVDSPTIPPQGYSRVALAQRVGHDAPWDGEIAPAAGDLSGNAPYSAEVGDLVIREPHDRTPFLARLIAVEDAGHADETFCLTVDVNHNMVCGEGQQFIICSNCDDPHNVKESESDDVRKETIRWFRESMSSRLNDLAKSAVIIIMQRVHEEDVSGVVLSEMSNDYEHLLIPMEWEGSRTISTVPNLVWNEDPRTKHGELAFPARFAPKEVTNLKIALGPYATAGQLQQMPTPRGGGIFKRDWWQPWEAYNANNELVFPQCELVVASFDGAFGKKQENDYSALTIWGLFRNDGRGVLPSSVRTPRPYLEQITDAGAPMAPPSPRRFVNPPKLILMHAWRHRLPLNGMEIEREDGETDREYRVRASPHWGIVQWVADSCKRFRAHHLLVEAKANGIDVANEVERQFRGDGWRVQLIDPGQLDKVARAYSVQHLLADRMIYCVDREWADEVVTEMSVFPKSTHDDYTDTATQAWKWLRDNGLLVHSHELEREMAEALMHKGPPPRPLYPI